MTKRFNLKPEELAPLTDAGLTPYRGIKKLRDAGALGPGRILAVFGIGGLGTYGVQYAKLLSGGSTVVAFARNDEKLAIAKDFGADYIINIKGKSTDDIRTELSQATGQGELDAVIDLRRCGRHDLPRLQPPRPWRPLLLRWPRRRQY